MTPTVNIEVLIPDFLAKENSLRLLSQAAPEVIAHNIETVRRLSPDVRPQARYERSLQVLHRLGQLNGDVFIKSSLMVGLGEREEEILETMSDLRQAGCQILTIGQYLSPGTQQRYWPVERFVAPEDFERYRQIGMDMGFVHVQSAPLVRSSYIAEKGYSAAKAAALNTARQAASMEVKV
jgi:lipoic acid synthetase